jgi:hypothetical protein
MSSYPDDRYDDDRRDDAQPGGHAVERGRAAVRAPATLLIVVGVLCALSAIINMISLPGLPAKCDEMIQQVDNDPNIAAADKQKWKDLIGQFKDMAAGPGLWVAYSVMGVIGAVIILGGVKLLSLSGTALPMTSAFLAMIPCTSGCCCLLGLPAGIWALVALSRPDVKAALAANRSARFGNPDDQYIR